MPLMIKPHTATIRERSNNVAADGGIVGVDFNSGAARVVKGHLVKVSAAQALERYGIDSDGMGRWFQDIGPSFEVGDVVDIGGENWRFTTLPVTRNAESITSYMESQVQRHDG